MSVTVAPMPIPVSRESSDLGRRYMRAALQTAVGADCRQGPPSGPASSTNRTTRIFAAWSSSFTSKIATLLVQLVSIPAAYRSLGAEAFVAYAAVTSVVAILGFLDFGMGGAMVSPLAHASASHDVDRERQVVAAALLPVVGLASLIGVIALPTIAVFPLPALFGQASKVVSASALRGAALLACVGTLAAVPLSVVRNARQSYQELHISYAVATLFNTMMFVGILLVSSFSPTLISFVAVRVLIPVLGQAADAAILLHRRPYLLDALRFFALARAKAIVRDGVYFMGATSTNTLLYQWSTYLMTRTRPPAESARFAVCMQVVLLALSFLAGLAQPLWGATADACAVRDHAWVRAAIARVQVATVAYGIAAALGFGLLLNFVVSAWLRMPMTFQAPERWLAGLYVLFAGWEYGHWTLCLGQGRMKPASLAIFTRAVAFSIVAPFVAPFATQGLLCALCASTLLCTSWYYPHLVSRDLGLNA